MRSPELPDGSVFMSSALAWIMMDVPPLANRELASLPCAEHDVLILHRRLRGAVRFDREIRHVAGVVAIGVIEPVLLAGGIEVPAGRLEVGRIAHGVLVEVHRMFAGRQVLERQLHFHALSLGDNGCGPDAVTFSILQAQRFSC